jgi:diguanylate cyclase (GGDEF)-like protein/PAS domain S-box-containing protein
MDATGRGLVVRVRARLGGHVPLATLAAAPAVWLGSLAGLVADLSIFTVVAVFLVAELLTLASYALWPGAQSGWRLHARIAAQLAAIIIVIYAIGWGPTMAIGLLFGVADNLRESGSKVTVPAVSWSLVGIALGEAAIALELTPSLVREPLVHGLAVLAAMALVFTILLLGSATAHTEEAEAGLRASGERFRALVQNASDIILVADRAGDLIYVSPAFERILGYHPEDALGTSARLLVHEDDVEVVERSIEEVEDTHDPPGRTEVRLRDSHGRWRWFEVSVTNLLDDPAVGGMVANLRDVDERRAIAERLAHAAIHDPLTGLPNRTLLVDRLSVALDRTRRGHDHVGVIFLDLDRFKLVNDSLGHATGDELLRVLAQRLRGATRPSDTIARFGGDEFVVLCAEMPSAAEIMDAAVRVADAITRPVSLPNQEIFVTASLGVATSADGQATPEELLRDADAAMYRAKELGRARVELFDERSHSRAMSSLETGSDLHRALERREFELHYQPIVELRTGRVTGFEALLRWRHASRGMVLPGDFIPLAEETGLVVPIGRWVLEEACRQTVEWQAKRPAGAQPLSISVNVAPRQLAERGFPDDLASILEAAGISPSVVVLELTESALIDDVETVSRILDKVAELGVHIAVDDFGTGYSALTHLKRFPVRSLKVDRSFVNGLGRNADDASIVNATVSLAHSLGLSAVAEGLETEEQLAALRVMGCDYAQGYLFGRPKPAISIGDEPADNLVTWQTATN